MINPKKITESEYHKSWRAEQTKKGLCIECTNPVVPGFKKCGDHLIKHNYHSRKSYCVNNVRIRKRVTARKKLLLSQGKCACCGEDDDTGNILCTRCADVKSGRAPSLRGTKYGITYHTRHAG